MIAFMFICCDIVTNLKPTHPSITVVTNLSSRGLGHASSSEHLNGQVTLYSSSHLLMHWRWNVCPHGSLVIVSPTSSCTSVAFQESLRYSQHIFAILFQKSVGDKYSRCTVSAIPAIYQASGYRKPRRYYCWALRAPLAGGRIGEIGRDQ